jgi:hypothetical protein
VSFDLLCELIHDFVRLDAPFVFLKFAPECAVLRERTRTMHPCAGHSALAVIRSLSPSCYKDIAESAWSGIEHIVFGMGGRVSNHAGLNRYRRMV